MYDGKRKKVYMNIGFIGFGNMASAIAKGLIHYANVNPSNIYACAKDFTKLVTNCNTLHINACQTHQELIEASDIVILATKPYQIHDILAAVNHLLTNKIVISIAAGIYFEDLENMLMPHTAHISTIPNTPIVTGKGILICEDRHSLNQSQYQLFTDLFSKIALIEVIDTPHFSIAGTLAGCTPAFTAMYLEALGDAGVKYGLTRPQAYRLAAKMLEGTGALYLSEGQHPGSMKDAVCSPGGTTIKGVASLEKDGFRGTIIHAIDAIEG